MPEVGPSFHRVQPCQEMPETLKHVRVIITDKCCDNMIISIATEQWLGSSVATPQVFLTREFCYRQQTKDICTI